MFQLVKAGQGVLAAMLLAVLFASVPVETAEASMANQMFGFASRDSVVTARRGGRTVERAPTGRQQRGTRSAGYQGRAARRSASYDGGSWGGGYSGGGGGVRWVASSGCLNGALQSAIAEASQYGRVTVSSTCRSHAHNARVGGAPRSKHLTGDAADFRVSGNTSAVYAALRSNGSLGGVKHYGGGLFHIDTGPKRSW